VGIYDDDYGQKVRCLRKDKKLNISIRKYVSPAFSDKAFCEDFGSPLIESTCCKQAFKCEARCSVNKKVVWA
jgi:hypothetical protein